ncbi:LuxR family transcriptional regulator [Sphingomonas sp. Leaf231]|nr:LuxR family transcriptional regulator [Sphingomonas sp. Leaf231]
MREGLRLASSFALPGAVVDQAASVAEAEQLIARTAGYQCCILDLLLPDSNGFSGLMAIQHRLGRTPIALFSDRDGPILVSTAKALGAAGFILKSVSMDETVAILRRLLAGGTVFPSDAEPSLHAQEMTQRLSTLSAAQMRVLVALADGRANKQIARDLDVSEATVKAHLTAIFRKLGVVNRTQALLTLQPILGDIGTSATRQ